MKAVAYFQKESRNLTRIIKKRYNEENFPDNNGLAETCLIVRKHNDLNCIDFMTQWYEEIKLYSHRDQLSFNYIYWKTRYKYVKYIYNIPIELLFFLFTISSYKLFISIKGFFSISFIRRIPINTFSFLRLCLMIIDFS